MKLFTYKAMDKSGSLIIDTINAKNINEVENEIEKRKLIAIKISERKKISTIFLNKKKILNLKQTSELSLIIISLPAIAEPTFSEETE